MDLNDYIIDGKDSIKQGKSGIRKEQLDKKYHNLFDAYDTNRNGTLDASELNVLNKNISTFAGTDKVLSTAEANAVNSVFKTQAGIEDADFMGFVKGVSAAGQEIIATAERTGEDGGKIVETKYKNGLTETIYFYPDGDFKLKTQFQDEHTKSSWYTYNGKNYTEQERQKLLDNEYAKYKKQMNSQSKPLDMTGGRSLLLSKELFIDNFLKNNPQLAIPHTNSNHIFIDNTELSDRAKKDVEVRDFVLRHFIETHTECKEALDSLGLLDKGGALINAGAGEAWNWIKNKWNGTEEEYKNFYELLNQFEGTSGDSYGRSVIASGRLDDLELHPAGYFDGYSALVGSNYTSSNGSAFQSTTERFQSAQILKNRVEILQEAMNEISYYETEQNALKYSPVQSEGMNPTSHLLKANKLLLDYFGGDKSSVELLMRGSIGNASATISAIKGLLDETTKMYESVLNGRSFEEVKEEYRTQYKNMYGTDFVPEDLTEKVFEAKATGSFVKLAAITAISVLITRSPMMAQLTAAAGGAEASGAAANLVRSLLAAKISPKMIQQGIKFAMSTGTLSIDVGLTLLNQVTSEHGVDAEELGLSALSSAKYIYFGSYIGAPVAEAVGKSFGKIGLAKGLFKGGRTSTTAAGATETTVTGEQFAANLLERGKSWMPKALSKGSAIATEIGMFTALEVTTDGANVGDAFKEQSTFLPKLKIMNHVLEYMLGARAHTGTKIPRAKMESAIEKSGIKNWNIKEIKTDKGTFYTVDVEGIPIARFESPDALAAALVERVSVEYANEVTPTIDKNSPEKQDIYSRLANANSREEFVAIRDEIKTVQNPEERQALGEAYTNAYRDWASKPERPNIRMEYKPVDEETNSEPAGKIQEWFEIELAFDATGESKTAFDKIIKLMSDNDGNISPKLLKLVEKIKDGGVLGAYCDAKTMEKFLASYQDNTGKITETRLLEGLSERNILEEILKNTFTREAGYINSITFDSILNSIQDSNGKIKPELFKFIMELSNDNLLIGYGNGKVNVIENLLSSSKNKNGTIDLPIMSKMLTELAVTEYGSDKIEIVEYDGIKIPKLKDASTNCSGVRFNKNISSVIKYAKDSNGDLSLDVYEKIKQFTAKEGFELDKLVNIITDPKGNIKTELFEKYLELGLLFDNHNVMENFMYALEVCKNVDIDALVNNPLPTIKLANTLLAKEENLYQFRRYMEKAPISELQYEIFEKLKTLNPDDNFEIPAILGLVNENNIEILNLLTDKHNKQDLTLKNGKTISASKNEISLYTLKDILIEAKSKEVSDIIVNLIKNEEYLNDNYVNSRDLRAFASVANNNPQFTKTCLQKGVKYDYISSLHDFINGNVKNELGEAGIPLNETQQQFAIRLAAEENRFGRNIINDYELTFNLNQFISKLDPKYYEPIIKVAKNMRMAYPEHIYNGIKNIEASSPACRELFNWCIENDIKISIERDMPDCAKITEAKKNEIIEYLKTKPLTIENNTVPFSALVNNIDKIKFFDAHPELAKRLENQLDMYLSIDEIRVGILERSAKSIERLNPELINKIDNFTETIFEISCAAEYGMIPLNKLNVILDASNELAKYDSTIAQRLFKMLIRNDNILSLPLISLKENIAYVADALKNGRYDNDDILKSIIFSNGVDFNQNLASLNALIEDKDKIVKDLKLKCQNTSPKFADKIQQFFESENFEQLLVSSGLTRNCFTENLFSASKLLNYIDKKPQDFVNGELNENRIKLIKQLLQYEDHGSSIQEDKLLKDAGIDTSAPDFDFRKAADDIDAAKNVIRSIEKNIDDKFPQIISAIAATDIETVKLLLDKRLTAFSKSIDHINSLVYQDKELLSDMIRNGKRIDRKGNIEKLTGQQKLDLIEIIACIRDVTEINGESFDYSKYKTPVKGKTYILDIDALRQDVFKIILQKAGLSENEINNLKPENINWDMSKISLLARKPARDEGELSELVREASRGNFSNYIKDTSNPHGAANAETASAFAQRGLNYDNWQTGPQAQSFKIGSKDYTVKLWNRIPQESLFDGSYTTCCTALDGTNGGSMANYMLNTAINVVEVRDNKGNVVAMSRCYIGEIDGKNTFIIENIEANNGLIKDMATYQGNIQLTEGIFNYIKDFASSVGGPDMPVLMSTSYNKIGIEPFVKLNKVKKENTFVGKISKDKLYLNTYHGYVDTKRLNNKEAEFYVVR